MRRTAETARRYYSITKHVGLLPTHPEKYGPISLLFDLLEQWKEHELPLRALPGSKSGQKLSLLAISHDDEETSQAIGGGTGED